MDGGLQLWNAVTKESGPVLLGHTETVLGIAFSPHDQWIASSSQDNTVRLWDVSTGALLSTLNGHENFVYGVAISPDGLQLASGGADERIRLWEMNSNRSSSSSSSLSTAELQGHNAGGGPVLSVVYSPDGGSIMSVCDHTFRQWDATTGAIGSFSFDFPRPRNMEATVFSPDGNHIISSDDKDGFIQLWDRHTGAEGLLLEGHTSQVIEMAYSPCGRWIASASWDNVVRLWDLHDPKQNRVIDGMGDDVYESVGSLMFTRAKELRFAVSASNGFVRFFHPPSGELLLSKKLSESRIQHMTSSPDGRQLALNIDFSVFLWDMQSDKPSVELKGHTGYVYTIAYSPCGQWITTGSEDRTVRVWRRGPLTLPSEDEEEEEEEVENWSCAYVVRGFLGTIRTIVWNHVKPLEFVTGCIDGSVRVWQVSSGSVDGDYDNDNTVSVKLIWGSNLRILCAEGLAFESAVGLASKHQTLLSQRRFNEGTTVASGGDGWGEEASGGTEGDGWGDVGSVNNRWDYAGTARNGDGWGDSGGASHGGGWGDEGVADVGTDGWGDEEAATTEGDNWGDEEEVVDFEEDGYCDEEAIFAKEEGW
ncbi:hypothetical protein BGZ95_001541 [Linnemannia exigua]|uniref:WD40 repeat-like protein n=1 Tax=Linnemannia exigua TaxID=604196 RepID=A0AAD4D759_9FUNG|nr:hypothetical protein BGZ95_001541 [Linnemannia exigua]